jgi:hypothetical protein
LILHVESPEIENSRDMEIYEVPTLDSKGKDSIEHGSFILYTPHEPCLHHASSESAMLGAQSTHKGYNCLMVLACKKFRKMVVDANAYHNIADFMYALWH